jgi:ABC-type transport system involved in cytochrome bd biosynthesis fused ATPase/permease subunit
MSYIVAIILIVAFLFLPIIGCIVGYIEAMNNKSTWELDNDSARFLDGK